MKPTYSLWTAKAVSAPTMPLEEVLESLSNPTREQFVQDALTWLRADLETKLALREDLEEKP